MHFLTYVLKSINLLNLLLVAAVASLIVYLLNPLLNAKVAYKPPAVAQQAPRSKEENPAIVQSPPAARLEVAAAG